MKQFRWQPEPAITTIYWSLTFAILFLSIIGLFEETSLNVFSVVVFFIFCFFVWLGRRRVLKVKETNINLRAVLKKNNKSFSLEEIEKISVGLHGITLFLSTHEELPLLMTKKEKQAFLGFIEESAAFTGKIESVEKSVGL